MPLVSLMVVAAAATTTAAAAATVPAVMVEAAVFCYFLFARCPGLDQSACLNGQLTWTNACKCGAVASCWLTVAFGHRGRQILCSGRSSSSSSSSSGGSGGGDGGSLRALALHLSHVVSQRQKNNLHSLYLLSDEHDNSPPTQWRVDHSATYLLASSLASLHARLPAHPPTYTGIRTEPL